jgi:hypothetical protein
MGRMLIHPLILCQKGIWKNWLPHEVQSASTNTPNIQTLCGYSPKNPQIQTLLYGNDIFLRKCEFVVWYSWRLWCVKPNQCIHMSVSSTLLIVWVYLTNWYIYTPPCNYNFLIISLTIFVVNFVFLLFCLIAWLFCFVLVYLSGIPKSFPLR